MSFLVETSWTCIKGSTSIFVEKNRLCIFMNYEFCLLYLTLCCNGGVKVRAYNEVIIFLAYVFQSQI